MASKTVPTIVNPLEYINSIENKIIAKDGIVILKLLSTITKQKPVMWGKIIGYGSYHYKYESGREGDIFQIGFALSKKGITLYGLQLIINNIELTNRLGNVRVGKGCIYIKRLEDIDLKVLKSIFLLKMKSIIQEH
jgi:Domain of unknown function (DU1801)